ncbi:MAG: Ubiquinone biosynthesis protein coq9, mitochondrial [Trizodia sp. TS-e1964]|nr:MAG: Ubiquinone biosynthesis protein coq9, mitochondrial [Trizodia sp. TS-e1964]
MKGRTALRLPSPAPAAAAASLTLSIPLTLRPCGRWPRRQLHHFHGVKMLPARPACIRKRSCAAAAAAGNIPWASTAGHVARPRCFHSTSYPPPPGPFNRVQSGLLAAALPHVPSHGFSERALALGAQDAGYLDASINILPRRAFDLVHYYLLTQREALKTLPLAPAEAQVDAGLQNNVTGSGILAVGTVAGTASTADKIRLLLRARLRANATSGVIPWWPEALALMALPSNAPTAVLELAQLADEMCFLAGATAVDSSWYTTRASIAGIYSSTGTRANPRTLTRRTTELFMTQDSSPAHTETLRFLDRRLDAWHAVGSGMADASAWLAFSAHAALNVLRAKGVRL